MMKKKYLVILSICIFGISSCSVINKNNNLLLGESVDRVVLCDEIVINNTMDSLEVLNILEEQYQLFTFKNHKFSANLTASHFSISGSGTFYSFEDEVLNSQDNEIANYNYIETIGSDLYDGSLNNGIYKRYNIETYSMLHDSKKKTKIESGEIYKFGEELRAVLGHVSDIDDDKYISYKNPNIPSMPLTEDKNRFSMEELNSCFNIIQKLLPNSLREKLKNYHDIKFQLYENYIFIEINNEYGLLPQNVPPNHVEKYLNKGYYCQAKMYFNVETLSTDFVYLKANCDGSSTHFKSLEFRSEKVELDKEQVKTTVNDTFEYIKQNTEQRLG